MNKIDKSTKYNILSATKYFGWITNELINLKPVYQRPYTYQDELGVGGNKWQKSLIRNFLLGGFIQPIHLLDRRDKKKNYFFWIIDGGHRTRTLYNFFVKGWLKTPKGLEIDWNGKTFDIGDKTWNEIVLEYNELEGYLDELQLMVITYKKTVSEGRELLLTLNDLHNMTKMEKLNPYEHHLSNTVRYFGDVSLSPLPMFNEFGSDGKLTHINMRTIKRVTDELVLWISDFIEKGGDVKKYTEPNWTSLKGWYVELDKSPTISKKWKKGTTKNKHLENLLLKLDELVLNSDRKRTDWKKNVLVKMSILINHFYEKIGYNWNGYDVDWKLFNKHVDEVMGEVNRNNKTHHPYTRYSIVNNEVVVTDDTKSDKSESYTIDRVFTGGSRIDDIEFWYYNMINSGKTFGLKKIQPRSFTDNQKLTMFTGKCEKCGTDITLSESHGDHVVSYSKNGETKLYNGESLCSKCNLDKGSTVTDEDRQKSLDKYIQSGGSDISIIRQLSGVK